MIGSGINANVYKEEITWESEQEAKREYERLE